MSIPTILLAALLVGWGTFTMYVNEVIGGGPSGGASTNVVIGGGPEGGASTKGVIGGGPVGKTYL